MDTTFTNDIALVRLSQEVDYTQWVSPVKLPQLGQNKKYYGETAYVSGWGIRGPGLGPSFSLKGAALTVRNNKLSILILICVLKSFDEKHCTFSIRNITTGCRWSCNERV